MLCKICGTEFNVEKCPLCQTPADSSDNNVAQNQPLSQNQNTSFTQPQPANPTRDNTIAPVNTGFTMVNEAKNIPPAPIPPQKMSDYHSPNFNPNSELSINSPVHSRGNDWANDSIPHGPSIHVETIKKDSKVLQIVILIIVCIVLLMQFAVLGAIQSLENQIDRVEDSISDDGYGGIIDDIIDEYLGDGDYSNFDDFLNEYDSDEFSDFFSNFDNYDEYEDYFGENEAPDKDFEALPDDDDTLSEQESLYPNGVSPQEFSLIEVGMSYAQISTIIGGDAQITGDNASQFTATWYGEYDFNTTLVIEFVDNIAVSIDQIGLE